jgi:hypothetical protein
MEQEEFQGLVLEHLAKITQEVAEIKTGQQQIENRVTKLEMRIEHEVVDKIKAVYEKVDSIDQRLSAQEEELVLLKRLK